MLKNKVLLLILLLVVSLIIPVKSENSHFTKEATIRGKMGTILKWRYLTQKDMRVFSTPTVADLDRDSFPEVIITSENGKVYCLNNVGELNWTFSTDDEIYSSPAVTDLDGDGKLEVLVTSDDDNIYCLNAIGKINWFYNHNSSIRSSPAVADIDGDKFMEIIVGSTTFGPPNAAGLFCLNATGALKWSYSLGKSVISTPSIVDIDSDGILDILIGANDGFLYCFNADGSIKWMSAIDPEDRSSLAFGDLDKDGKLEILVSSRTGWLYCLSDSGEKKWRYSFGWSLKTSPTVTNLFGDEKLEIIIGYLDNIYCLNATGDLQWVHPILVGADCTSPSVADLDGDGILEIVIGGGSSNQRIYCLSNTGDFLWSFPTEGVWFSDPIIVDLYKNGRHKIIVGDEGGYVYCIGITGIESSGAQQWHTFGGSMFHTRQMDSDRDYLDDLTENYYQTQSNNPDSDGDFYSDGLEVFSGTNPTNRTDHPSWDPPPLPAPVTITPPSMTPTPTPPTPPPTTIPIITDTTKETKSGEGINWGLVFPPLFLLVVIPLVIRKNRK